MMMAERRDSWGLLPEPGAVAAPPDWLVAAMLRGIYGLCRHALQLRPLTVEAERAMAEAWAAAACMGSVWDEAMDRSRFQVAFALLEAGHRERGAWDASKFPNVNDLLSAIPCKYKEEPDRSDKRTAEEKEKAEEARQRAIALMKPDEQAPRTRMEQIAAVNVALRRAGITEFGSDVELRKHQLRQRHAGELIAQVKE